jgi:hypothetical protein
MDINRNTFKRGLQKRELLIGLWSSLCSNLAAEIIAHSGFDWILLDTEHSPNEIPDLVAQLQAMGQGTASPVVRAAWNDTVLIKRILDIGAQSILLPYVQTAEEARRAVAAVRYPPRGVRGVAGASRASNFGRVKDYLKKADDEICLLVQLESRAALEQLESISAIEGVDGVFVRPICPHRSDTSVIRSTPKRKARCRTPAAGLRGWASLPGSWQCWKPTLAAISNGATVSSPSGSIRHFWRPARTLSQGHLKLE